MSILSKINIGADFANRLEIISLFKEIGEIKKILEIGPGNKPLIVEYLEHQDLYGIEYPGCAEETIKAAISKGKDIVMKECDINSDRWPFDDNEFDVIVINQVLEHMFNTDHFFENFYRILKMEAYGVISCLKFKNLPLRKNESFHEVAYEVKKFITNCSRILYIGCGSGKKVGFLRRWGMMFTESMIFQITLMIKSFKRMLSNSYPPPVSIL